MVAFAHSLARCATPKRCCSSTIARPRFWNSTVSSINACVPIRICSVPSFDNLSVSFRIELLVEPVSMPTLTGKSPSNETILSKCCCARISVGAIRHPWKPLSTASNKASSATTVFPLPTSPCNRRFICLPVRTSCLISFNTLFCAPVNWNGSFSL